jgi:uncharacterized protein DUF1326
MRILATVLSLALVGMSAGHNPAAGWSLNATAIEACSCPMFCQCYFSTKPAGHHEHDGMTHYCKFNMAYHINHGNVGAVKLDGAKFWISGDLGSEFGGGQTDWAHVTFDKSMSPKQREALTSILPQVFPVKWKSFDTAEGSVDTWKHDAHSADATLDGGKTAEVHLVAAKGTGPGPVVMHNLKYWGTPRNTGFVMMPNQLEAYRVGDKAFEFKDTNGFMITIDMNSKDVPAAKPSM